MDNSVNVVLTEMAIENVNLRLENARLRAELEEKELGEKEYKKSQEKGN